LSLSHLRVKEVHRRGAAGATVTWDIHVVRTLSRRQHSRWRVAVDRRDHVVWVAHSPADTRVALGLAGSTRDLITLSPGSNQPGFAGAGGGGGGVRRAVGRYTCWQMSIQATLAALALVAFKPSPLPQPGAGVPSCLKWHGQCGASVYLAQVHVTQASPHLSVTLPRGVEHRLQGAAVAAALTVACTSIIRRSAFGRCLCSV
jgi:hypothetical protein